MTAKRPAPSGIVARIVALEMDSLEEDRRQQLWADEGELIAVVSLDLDDDGITDYLAYPAFYLPTFFGAHSISCWVFRGTPDGTHNLVLSGRHDAVRILRNRTNGLCDIELIYWAAEEEVTHFRFDGQRYRQSAE